MLFGSIDGPQSKQRPRPYGAIATPVPRLHGGHGHMGPQPHGAATTYRRALKPTKQKNKKNALGRLADAALRQHLRLGARRRALRRLAAAQHARLLGRVRLREGGYGHGPVQMWPCPKVMALHSYGPTRACATSWRWRTAPLHSYGRVQLRPCTVMALYSYGRVQLWPCIVMAVYSYGPIFVWPCIVMALHSYGAI